MDFKVSREKVVVSTHHNADSLEVVLVGDIQCVSQKGVWETGKEAVIIPARSILPKAKKETFLARFPFLEENLRVKAIRLRDEPSEGILLKAEEVAEIFGVDVSEYALGEDLSSLLGITRYEPPVPKELQGEALVGVHLRGPKAKGSLSVIHYHDCDQLGGFAYQLDPAEIVQCGEKLHGSQINLFLKSEKTEAGDWVWVPYVTTKNQLKKGIFYKETETNSYWRGIRTQGIIERLEAEYTPGEGQILQLVGELLNVQRGFPYGFASGDVGVKWFSLLVNGEFQETIPYWLKANWVPILYVGPWSDVDVYSLCKGKETVSGKELHIREGLVLTPVPRRRNYRGNWISLKVISPAYSKKETGEEFN